MLPLSPNLQTAAYLIALIELIVGLYVFILDYRSRANRLVCVTLIIVALNTFALGNLITAREQAVGLPVMILSATTPLIVALLLVSAVFLLRPDFLIKPWGRRLLAAAAIIGALPVVLTVIDGLTGSDLWFTPLAQGFAGEIFDKSAQSSGGLSFGLNLLIYGGIGISLLIFLSYVIVTGSPNTRRGRIIAVLLLTSTLISIAPNPLGLSAQQTILFNLAATTGYLTAFTISAFEHNQQSRSTKGSLQTRLTLAALVIALPLLAAMGLMLTSRARQALEENAAASLASVNQNIVDSAEIWLTSTARSLRTLTADEGIRSIDPARQTPVLRSLTSIYPDIYLAATIDANGRSVASSDDRPGLNYSDRDWFQETSSGLPLSYQVIMNRATGKPVLEMAMPIRDSKDNVIGVAMFASQLDQIDRLVKQETNNAGASVLIVNNNNQLVATSENRAALMLNLSPMTSVSALRSGIHGPFRYIDNADNRWISNINILSNGWGVIVQVTEAELFAPIRSFQRLSLIILGIGALILLGLTWSTIRQAIQPVRHLTNTAAAITAGDLSRVAPVYSQDELGVLAESFNTMTAQLRDLISSLESRVAERTREVERRAVQLQTTADVAREAAAIHDPEKLLTDVAAMISERFGFYHAGIFLLEGRDESSTNNPEIKAYAILRAASSEGGQRMLARGHRLAVGRTHASGQGIVGYVASSGKPRIALDVGSDAVFFNNPDLPMTRSEMALPLKLGEQVIGVLDVQSRKPSAFTSEDEVILQTLADQLAVAIENTRLINESRQALKELEVLYGRQVQRGWQKRLGNQMLSYRISDGRVDPVGPSRSDLPIVMVENNQSDEETYVLEAPIDLRGTQLGTLHLRRQKDDGPWTNTDFNLARETISQMAQALENARLLEEIQYRAAREEAINRITTNVARSLDLEGVLRVAAVELGKLPAVREAAVIIGAPESVDPSLSEANPPNGDHTAEFAKEIGEVSQHSANRAEGQHKGDGNGHRP